jgi:hypothetical protein
MKIDLPGIFIRSADGPLSTTFWSTIFPPREPLQPNWPKHITRLKAPPPIPTDKRPRSIPYLKNMPEFPDTRKAECSAWKTCDAYYTAHAERLRKQMRALPANPPMSPYDKWMALSVPHILRGLNITPYDFKYINTFTRLRLWQTDPATFPLNPDWPPVPVPPACQTHGLSYAESPVYVYKGIYPNPTVEPIRLIYAECSDVQAKYPTAFFIRWRRRPAPADNPGPWSAWTLAYSFKLLLAEDPTTIPYGVDIQTALPTHESRYYIPQNLHRSETLTATASIVTPYVRFRHWPRIPRTKRDNPIFKAQSLDAECALLESHGWTRYRP